MLEDFGHVWYNCISFCFQVIRGNSIVMLESLDRVWNSYCSRKCFSFRCNVCPCM